MMTTPTAAASSSTDVNSSNSQEEMMTHEERLQLYLLEYNILELPPAPKAAANYCPCQRSGDLLYLSGHLPFSSIIIDENNNNNTTTLEPYTGRLGGASRVQLQDDDAVIMEPDAVTIGYNAAKQAGLNIIATIRNELGGSINDVDQIIKLFGLVQSTNDFHQQHLVMNGCSDVMTHVFGPITGKHARSAGRLGGASRVQLQDDDAVIMEPDAVTMGYNAAKQAGLNIIATIRNELGGSINNVDQIIKLFGLVQSTNDFHQQHLVMNGCSDVMTHVFGPITGKHARSAVGTNALPLNSMIEIEAIVRLKPSSYSSSS